MLRGRKQLKGFVVHAVRSLCARLQSAGADQLVGAADRHAAAHILSVQIGNKPNWQEMKNHQNQKIQYAV